MTYSILAVDRAHRAIGIATATFSLAVGNSVPAIDPAAGAVASQAWPNRDLRHLALEALRDGAQPASALASALRTDGGAAYRQLAVMGLDGAWEVHTGESCTPWAGHRAVDGMVIAGNYLAGSHVLDAAADAWGATPDLHADVPPDEVVDTAGRRAQRAVPQASVALAKRLVAALLAAEDAGGDARGRQSASLIVSSRGERVQWPPATDIDLRVDDDDRGPYALAALLDHRLGTRAAD
ncbi:DUF1028 domain-containing protein [Demequina muriae]|uniref:DUF1028 domain-containing protein n=1 Tax=Demequina muriae TaxID=3051664 RepID=A0ABT8GHR1_9MICO|nr:DUF1028 domain-containing protein [Demequina sp. EGI L300058]MDN4480972.1 DUF1028 domain-containing protein [Demequina sp. EGI L300058]